MEVHANTDIQIFSEIKRRIFPFNRKPLLIKINVHVIETLLTYSFCISSQAPFSMLKIDWNLMKKGKTSSRDKYIRIVHVLLNFNPCKTFKTFYK